jgi:hypothetical protein
LDNSTVGYGDISPETPLDNLLPLCHDLGYGINRCLLVTAEIAKENTQNKIVTDKKTMYWLVNREIIQKR